ncbi:hypothetical protein Tco_1393338 [Tanacetum coccineum]
MRILSVVRIEVFSMYGYNYMKKIVLRRADLKEYVIAERDFKYMYPSDFEDLYLLNLQGHLNHLSPEDKKILTTAVNLWTRNLVIRQRVEDFQLGIESYQTQLNLTKPRWEATGFEFKHDFTVIDSPRAVIFRDKYGVQMIMRFNEIHKFSDGTLQQIDEALDYRVKEFRINRTNPGMNARFWTKKDVDRSKDFMFAIQKRLKTRRIFRNLESFVGGRIREGDYRSYKDGKVRYSLPRSRQNRRDLPRDNPLVSVEVLRNRVNTYAVRITWLIADIEVKYHGPSDTLHNPPQPLKIPQRILVSFLTEINTFLSSPSLREILLKMNLPDHRSVLTDPEDQAKMEMETPRSSGVNSPPNAHT